MAADAETTGKPVAARGPGCVRRSRRRPERRRRLFPVEAGWADALALARIVLMGPGGTAKLDVETGSVAVLFATRARAGCAAYCGTGPTRRRRKRPPCGLAPEPGLDVENVRKPPNVAN